MLLEPVTVHPDLTLAELASVLRRTAQRQLPVVRDDQYVGMLDVDALPRGIPSERCVGELADPQAPALVPDDPVEGDDSALELLIETGLKAAAVVDAGRVIGLLALEDLAHVVEGAA
jgi:CBS domain-containing protein